MFTIWQAARHGEKTSWFSSAKEAGKPLLPFRTTNSNDPKTFWTSEQSKTTEAFGYNYPDVVGTGQKVISEFRRKYLWSVPLNFGTDTSKPPEDMEPLDFTLSEFCVDYGTSKEVEELKISTDLLQRIEKQEDTANIPDDSEFSYEWFVDDRVQRLVQALIR